VDKAFTDILVDEFKDAMSVLKSETRNMFKNTKPFRQVKVGDKDRIANYLSTPPEVKQQLMTDYGDSYTNYENEMQGLIDKYKGVE